MYKNSFLILWCTVFVLISSCSSRETQNDAESVKARQAALTRKASELYHAGRFRESEDLHRQLGAMLGEMLESDDLAVAQNLNDLAIVIQRQGHFDEAEALHRRAITIREKALGPDDPNVARSLSELAVVLLARRRPNEAEMLSRRALTILEKALGPDDSDVAIVLLSLGNSLSSQLRYAEAEVVVRRALSIWEKALGRDDVHAGCFIVLANVLQGQGRYAEAEQYLWQALALQEKSQDVNQPDIAVTLANLGLAMLSQDRLVEAEKMYSRARSINEALFGSESPIVASLLHDLALVYAKTGRYEEALSLSGKSLHILNTTGEFVDFENKIHLFTRIAWDLNLLRPTQSELLMEKSFSVIQLAVARQIEAVIAEVAARFAAGNDALAVAVRSRQDLVRQRAEIDQKLLTSYGIDGRREEHDHLLGELQAATDQLTQADTVLAERYPAYAELTHPQPTSIDDVSALLAPDEALLVYRCNLEQTYLWIVLPERSEWHLLDIEADDLASRITRLRSALDPGEGGGIGRPFPVAEAVALRRLLLPHETTALAGVRHLYIVPDGALRSLPFTVLPERGGELESVDWLVERYAITTLPAVSSLVALRRPTRGGEGNAPFAGIGDPSLDGNGTARGIVPSDLLGTRELADPAKLRALPALPGTGRELERLAVELGASLESIYLGDDATETKVKAGVLTDARVVAFATHAAVAGDLPGLAEPALILTPPTTATDLDDGLLTASEAAQLKLNADLVILSACNTAAPDGTPGAVGLSGLAKAFFYAGARALLVSNWEVYDEAAPALTTGMIEALTKEPQIGLAEALRRSELAMIHGGHPHPAEWAPFVVVGEGGAGRGIMPLVVGSQ